MLSPRAIKKFRARPSRDFSRWKSISVNELQRRADKLPYAPPNWKQLSHLQRVCFVIGARMRRFAFWNDTGTGKTFLSISLMQYFMMTGDSKHNLVLVPNKTNKWEWAEEGFDKHAAKMKYVVLHGSSARKLQQIIDNPDAQAFVETYAGFTRMCCDLKKVKRKGKKAQNKLVPNRTRVKKLAAFFDGVYADESTYLSNKSALPYRLLNQLSKTAKTFFCLSATPFGRDVTMVWAQMFLVDRGDTLGETLGLFRGAYFDEKVNYWGGYEYKLKPNAKNMIAERLNHGSITYPADESDLPRLNRKSFHTSLGETADAYYERAKAQLKASHGNYQEMKNAFLRMRQISSGFVGYRDDETGDKAKFVFPANPKLELLESLVTRIPEHYKFIIYHEFNYSAGVICAMLKRMGIKHVAINGMVKDTQKPLTQFKKKSNDVRALVLANSAGGYGLNLQVARYGIYYESPVSVIMRKQTEKRFDRQYSMHSHVFLWDCIVRGTADESILAFHKEGKSLWKAILGRGVDTIFAR